MNAPFAVTDATKLPEFLRNVAALVAIYLYFIGWVFVYYYYQEFGVSLYSLDIPVYYFFVYSSSVIANWWAVLAIVIFTAVCIVLRRWPFGAHVMAALVLLSFPLLFVISREIGIAEAHITRTGNAHTIKFSLKTDGAALIPEDFKKANGEGGLRLIAQTKDRYFVFLQLSKVEREWPRGQTFDVLKEQVLLVAITLDNME